MPGRDDEFDDDRHRHPDDDDRGHRSRRDDDDYDRPPPRRKGMSPGLIIGIVAAVCLVVCGTPICIGLLLPAVQNVRGAANRMKSSNNIKQMALAVHNYNDTNNELPGNSYGPDGKPLLSWRVHLLPYLEQDNLYKQFRLDEPWDSANNIMLLNQMPKIYANPNEPSATSKTYYRGFSSPGAVFEHRPGTRPMLNKEKNGPGRPGLFQPFTLASVKDLPNETILIIEAGDPVEWTKPDDLDASPGKPFPSLGGMKLHRNRIQVGFLDGSVRDIRSDLPETTLRALVTHSGGETIPAGWNDD
jgi:prepilin-type processing-associated H-X9-DG protein